MSAVLKRACYADMDLLFQWANDSQVRKNAFHTEQIPYEEHVKWFEKMMKDLSVYQYLLYEDDIPIGQIRLNVEGGAAMIDYSISAGYRGKGYGSRMLCLIEEQVAKDKLTDITTLIGQVKYENTASAHAFEKCGYRRQDRPEFIQYERTVRTEEKAQ